MFCVKQLPLQFKKTDHTLKASLIPPLSAMFSARVLLPLTCRMKHPRNTDSHVIPSPSVFTKVIKVQSGSGSPGSELCTPYYWNTLKVKDRNTLEASDACQLFSGAKHILEESCKVSNWHYARIFLHLGLPPPIGSHYTGQSYTGSYHWRLLQTSCSTTGQGCHFCHTCDLFMKRKSHNPLC